MSQVFMAVLCIFVFQTGTVTASTDDVINALKHNSVYVAPGVTGTDKNTASELQQRLNDKDHVIIIMLPDTASATTDTGLLLDKIDKATGGDKIIGLAVGDTIAAQSSTMPAGTAGELMKRAETVSTNNVETLTTFIRNVHDWQTAHPEATASQQPHSGPFTTWVVPGGGIILAITLIISGVAIARKRVHKKIRNNAPKDLKPLITRLLTTSKRVNDRRMTTAIGNVCKYTEAYFNRLHPDKRYNQAALDTFERHLESAIKVVDVYLDMQNNSEYFDDPGKGLQQGSDAIEGLAEFMLQSIKQKGRQNNTDYTVDTKILSAQRYR